MLVLRVVMRAFIITLVLAGMLVLSSVISGMSAFTDLSRYRPILDREPFGPIPDPSAAKNATEPSSKPPAFVKTLRLCAITESGDELRVGFVDIKKKPFKSYYMRIGDIVDGIELLDADYDAETILLKMNDEEHWLTMESGVTSSGGASGPSVPAAPKKNGSKRLRASKSARESYLQRLKARREALKKKMSNPNPSGEEIKKYLQKYQMDLIRAGGTKGPPLPIPLTREMDDKLVEEGVLPPAAE